MKKVVFRLMFILLSSLGFISTVSAQNEPAKEKAKNPSVYEVRLPVTVTDNKKQFVSNLRREDFIILENGRRQKATFFTDVKNNPPVYVGVLMDTSPSVQKKMEFVREAARNLVYSVTRLRKGKAAFLTFDHEINLLQDFTDKIDWLDTAINKVNKSGQQISLYDAIYQFCDQKLRGAPGRRALVIISDGKDNFSRAKLEDAIDIAQRTETTIFIVSTNNSSASLQNSKKRRTKNTDDDFLFKLTAETGGTAFFAKEPFGLEKSFAAILKEINSQYVITYQPTNQKYDGKKRKIKVQFADKQKNKIYKIRAKAKYRVLKANLK